MINEIDTGVSDKQFSDLSFLFIDFLHFHHHPSTCMYMSVHTHTHALSLLWP